LGKKVEMRVRWPI